MAAEDYFEDNMYSYRIPRTKEYRFDVSLAKCSTGAIASRHGQAWLPHEENTLKKMWRDGLSLETISAQLNRTPGAIFARINHLEMSINDDGSNPNVKSTSLSTVKSKVNKVNITHLLTLLQENYTTLDVEFQETPGKGYTYKVSNDIKATLEKGSYVVIDARGSFKVAKVMEVHDTPQIDVDSPFSLKWVVSKVDTTAYNDQLTREAEATKLLEDAKRRKAREEALKTLVGDVGIEEVRRLLNGSPSA